MSLLICFHAGATDGLALVMRRAAGVGEADGQIMMRRHDTGIGTYDGLRHISQAVNLTVRKIDKITIAAMQGYAIQTGFSLALACDYRIADTTAKMGSATLRFGLLPDEGGQYLLVQHLGLQRALDVSAATLPTQPTCLAPLSPQAAAVLDAEEDRRRG